MFIPKKKDEMVLNIINNLKTKLPINTDYTTGSVLRTLIEAIMNELDIQYWQLGQVYDNSFIDTAYGNDLDKLVSIMGISRIQPTKSKGNVIFYRTTPASVNYTIPAGTSIETLKDYKGQSIKFITTKDVVLPIGLMEVSVPIECQTPGISGNVTTGTIQIINNPSPGIESVRNEEPTSMGSDAETDSELRVRAKHALDTAGNGTVNSLKYKIEAIPGVKKAQVNDLARGIGTADILVLGDTMPVGSDLIDTINNVIIETKPSGIDVLLIEPTIITQNVSCTLTMKPEFTVTDVSIDVQSSIINYIDNLSIGETLIKNQLERSILNASDKIIDVSLTTPSNNITITPIQVIRHGTITVL
jgi:uncharacterized phage protein gp47/JayE